MYLSLMDADEIVLDRDRTSRGRGYPAPFAPVGLEGAGLSCAGWLRGGGANQRRLRRLA